MRTTLADSPADPRAAAVQAFADALGSAKSPLSCDRTLAQTRALVGVGMALLAVADAVERAASREGKPEPCDFCSRVPEGEACPQCGEARPAVEATDDAAPYGRCYARDCQEPLPESLTCTACGRYCPPF
jgi:hypothetical protein